MFLLKKKKIVIDAFTYNGHAEQFFKPAAAIDFVPDWWKTLSSSYTTRTDQGIEIQVPTLKRCDGILELYKRGFVIPLWSDLIVETNGQGSLSYVWSETNGMNISGHDSKQWDNKFQHLINCKIRSPWFFEEKTGVNFYWSNPVWNNLVEFAEVNVLPGVVNFKHQKSSNFNFMFENKRRRYEFKHGHPLAHLIQLSDSNIQIKTHLISEQEWDRKMIDSITEFSFLGSYKKRSKMMETKKCPFNFR